jgi:hypothetical protein
MKIQPMDCEKIFSNHTFDKGLISRMYEELNSIARKIPNLENGQGN